MLIDDGQIKYNLQVNSDRVLGECMIHIDAFFVTVVQDDSKFMLERRFLKKVKVNEDSCILWFQPFLKLTIWPPLPLHLFSTFSTSSQINTKTNNAEYEKNVFLEEELEYFKSKDTKDTWRISSVNSEYEVCGTLGKHWIVPEGINDTLLVHAARFRARSRLPILSYASPKCTLVRSSQPLCGLGYRRSVQDEKLIRQYALTKSQLIIVDARSLASALANAVTGKGGTELETFYSADFKIYLGLENVHAVRKAEYKMAFEGEEEAWIGLLENLVKAVWRLFGLVQEQECCLLVHCSDGWDRTAQLVSLLQVLLDAKYRTLRGLIMLVEKEWLAAGFQFTKRALLPYTSPLNGNINNEEAEEECGQIWGQFLNILLCWSRKCPELFEYGECELTMLWREAQIGGVLSGDFENDPLRDTPRRMSFWNSLLSYQGQTFNQDEISTSQMDVTILQETVLEPFYISDLNYFNTENKQK